VDLGFRSRDLALSIVVGYDFRLFNSVGLLFGGVVVLPISILHNKIPRAAQKGQVHLGRDPLYPGKADLERAIRNLRPV